MRAAILVPLLLLAACEREPDFETRYDDAQERIEETAKQIEADLGKDAPMNAADGAGEEKKDGSKAN